MKKIRSITSMLVAAILMFGCNNNNDDVLLKELKQQNAFLEEQLRFSRLLMNSKVQGNPAMIPYRTLFLKQDSVAMNYLAKLTPDKNLMVNYQSFIRQSNAVFFKAQTETDTKILPDDLPLTQLTFDSLLLNISSDSLKMKLIEQQILQCYLNISQIYTGASSICAIRYYNLDKFGYRLTIEKNKDHFLLNLKCYDRQRIPYFEKLELISLSRNDQENDYYPENVTDITSSILESKYEKDAIIMKTDPLSKGL